MRRKLRPATALLDEREASSPGMRAYPAQRDDNAAFLYAPTPDAEEYMLQYALSVWVYVAATRLAAGAASAACGVFRRNTTEQYEQHPLMQLLGQYAAPNELQDSGEFFEEHFLNILIAGNSYWYWSSAAGGAPDEVHLLDPRRVLIDPGSTRAIERYVYRTTMGRELVFAPEQITHFKRPNPFNRYVGLSALEAIRLEIASDRSMALWNNQFFGENVGIPAGILVLPPDTPDHDMDRVEAEMNAKYSRRRRTAVMRGTSGQQMYVQAGAAHKDLDFERGRMLSRQAVYEALELPLGLLSESSTEAHARVAERRFFAAVDQRLTRTARKMTVSCLPFWAGAGRYEVRFEDERRDIADWDQMSKKVASMMQTHSINEIRANIYNDKAVEWGERTDGNEGRAGGANQTTGTGGEGAEGADRENADSTQRQEGGSEK